MSEIEIPVLKSQRIPRESIDNGFESTVLEAARVRAFEHLLLDLFQEGSIFGTVHTCIGQEFCAAALHPFLKPDSDAFFATHRGHGHYLCHGGPADALLAELMGREGALCNGCGGTQNLAYKRFFSSGIQGGSAPIGVGYAKALATRGEEGIAVVQIGDGTLGEGTLYEAFTFAACLRVPVLFLLEWNGWAQSTDTSRTTPGDVFQRAAGFGIAAHRISDSDPKSLHHALRDVVAQVRLGVPTLQIIDTRRLAAHSKGDDDRSSEYLMQIRREDPLTRLIAENPLVESVYQTYRSEFRELADTVKLRPLLDASILHHDFHNEVVIHSDDITSNEPAAKNVTESLNEALYDLLNESSERMLLGEDLLDPYGGAFKVSRGLSTQFPEQVTSTPIAEAGMIGVANGLALAGMQPIVEMMFSDFVTLGADQLINFAAKFHSMYGLKVHCPLTVRLPSGAGRGYGPTHSQSLEYLFLGVPGLKVISISHRHRVDALLKHLVRNQDGPAIFVENKGLYSLRTGSRRFLDLDLVPTERSNGHYPPLCFRPPGGQADVTIVTYGGSAGIVEQAMRKLITEEELRFEYIILTQLWPLHADEVIDSVEKTKRLVVVEEGSSDYGIGAAIGALIAEDGRSRFRMRRVGSMPIPLPCARQLEDAVLPSVDKISCAVLELL